MTGVSKRVSHGTIADLVAGNGTTMHQVAGARLVCGTCLVED